MQKNILLVEDTPETAEVIRLILEEMGFTVELAVSGEEALSKIKKKPFDLVLLDIMLPRVDGFEVCRRIKSDPKTKAIPVICVTAFSVHEIEERCKQVNADDVVLKPFDPEDLINRIKKVLKM